MEKEMTNTEIINHISDEIDNSDKWIFISKNIIEKKGMQIYMLSGKQPDGIICMALFLEQNPDYWNILKEIMEMTKFTSL